MKQLFIEDNYIFTVNDTLTDFSAECLSSHRSRACIDYKQTITTTYPYKKKF